MSQSRPGCDDGRQEPGRSGLDDEIDALISGYRELHKDDARLRRIERTTYTGHRGAQEGSGAPVGGVRDEQIAPELRTQDLRRVAGGRAGAAWTRRPTP